MDEMTPQPALTEYQWWYGRDEPPLLPRVLRAGPVSANLIGRDLRNLRFGDAEIVQRIYVAVRDRNWGTVPGDVSELTIDEGEDHFAARFTVTHRQHDIDIDIDLDLVWRGEILGSPDGTISYAMDATAGADMSYKLIGLNVHHGMSAYAGRSCAGTTADGAFAARFPTEVAPQLIADETEVPIFPPLQSLAVDLADGVSVRFAFAGDSFECEDQRNWTDASFKSQSYPPRRGGLFSIRGGEHVWQKVTVTPTGTPPAANGSGGPIRIEIGEHPRGRIPPLGLGMASHRRSLSAREAALLRELRLDHLRADLRLADPGFPAELERAQADASLLGCGLELALHLTGDADGQLAELASRLGDESRIERVLVFREAEAATDPLLVELARRRIGGVAPNALFAGGTNANFCELNRFRPAGAPEDGIVYAITPQIHAFDELSLAENLACQAETVETAQAYGRGRPVVVSPVTLKPRFNSVATSAEPESSSDELPPQVDPRQMSLFGAGWTVGSLKRLIESGVSAATYYETTGWRGVIQGDAESPVPDCFPSHLGMIFPIYHVFADLAEWKNGEVISSSSSDPLAVETLAVVSDGNLHVLVANLMSDSRSVTIDAIAAGEVLARRLNASIAEAAAFRPESYRSRSESLIAKGSLELALAPFEVVRLDTQGSGW